MEKPVEYSVGCLIKKVDDKICNIRAYIQTEKRFNIDFNISLLLLSQIFNSSFTALKFKDHFKRWLYIEIEKKPYRDTTINALDLIDASVDTIVSMILIQYIKIQTLET